MMKTLTSTIAAAATGFVLLAGCGSSGPTASPSGAPSEAATAAPDSTSAAPGIVLPEGSELNLPQEPGGGQDALMMDGVYSLVSDGTVVTATAGSPAPTKTTDGFDTTATPLKVDQVLAGRPSSAEMTLLAGDKMLALQEGRTYMLVLSPSTESPVADAYTIGSPVSLLSDNGDGTWTSADRSVTVTLDEARAILKSSEEHLASRKRAGEAKLVMQVDRFGDRGQATVRGYAEGESLGIKFCLASEDPATAPSAQDCDAVLAQALTPTGNTQTFEFTTPTEIQRGPDDSVPCKDRCVLLVYDLDFPSQVFTTVPL